MNDRIRRLYEMFARVLNFMTANADDFQAIPFVAANVSELQTAVTEISNLAAEKAQNTAAAKDATISRGDRRDNLRDVMQDIADVWRSAIKEDTSAANKFRMPLGNNDQNLIAAAKSFAAEAGANQQLFLDRGMSADFVADLQTKITAFEEMVNESESARRERVGTNAAFDAPIKQAGNAVGNIEPVVNRTYRNDPQKMAEWMVASHIDRAPKSKNPGTPEV